MHRFSRMTPRFLMAGASGLFLVNVACGGGDPTATPRPTTPIPSGPPTATPTSALPARPTATPIILLGQPAAVPTSAAAPQATATVRPSQPAATPVPQPTAPPTPAASGAPDVPGAKYGGTLVRSESDDPPTWDGWQVQTQGVHDLLEAVMDSIIAYNPQKQDQLVPQLAESWSLGADSLTYTFKVRAGARFHNGNAMTAEDLRWSLDQMLNPPPNTLSFLRSLLTSVATVAAPDAQTVVVKLKEPDATFLPALAHGRMHIMDKEFITAEGRARVAKWPPVGTGPFMAKPNSYLKGVSYEAVRNPDYWVKGRPFLNGLKFFVVPDVGTQLAAFLSGQLNFDVRPNPVQEKELRARLGGKVTIQKTASTVTWSLYVDMHDPPFNNPKVREAAALALDRDGMIQIVEQGLGTVGGNVIPQTGFELSEAELKSFAGYSGERASNVRKAKQLLAEAGFPNGFSSKIRTRNIASYPPRATVLKANLEEIGIRADIELIPDAVYQTQRFDLGLWDIMLGAKRYSGTDPTFAFNQYWLTKAALNFSAFSDPQVDALFAAQNKESDPAKRRALVGELDKRVLGSYAVDTIYFQIVQYAWYSNIKNFFFHVNYPSNLQFRDVWIDS